MQRQHATSTTLVHAIRIYNVHLRFLLYKDASGPRHDIFDTEWRLHDACGLAGLLRGARVPNSPCPEMALGSHQQLVFNGMYIGIWDF